MAKRKENNEPTENEDAKVQHVLVHAAPRVCHSLFGLQDVLGNDVGRGSLFCVGNIIRR
jgi:hypothetical protein